MTNYKDFTDDKEKMRDFKLLTKAEFLSSYSHLTEEEYDLTKKQEEMMSRLTVDDVAVMLGCSDIPSEVDYRIEECAGVAIKGCVAVVYFYADKLSEEEQKTVLDLEGVNNEKVD